MLRAARLRQLHLMVPFAGGGFLLQCQQSGAMRAGDALLIVRRGEVFGLQRRAAAIAHRQIKRGEAMSHRHTLIKDKTTAVPQALLEGNGLQIFQNAALEVIHLRKSLLQHEAAGFFAADTARAEHGDFGIGLRVKMRAHKGRKFAKAFGFGVQRAAKCAHPHLKFIACIHQQHIGL